jgi:DNA-binding transcriptional MerR regulator
MASWSTAEVERLLGVKEHVLRYWEEEIPVLRPRKGPSGRKEYGEREVALLLRVKHLVQERQFTVEGAGKALLDELSGPDQDGKAALYEVRSGLLKLFLSLNKPGGKKG